ncbi:MAG: DUF2931 family protein [Alphaproteobacteria bacterium]|nr:DUF2931 family protein [Alphaproteobacteria bacterium]
MANKVLFAVIVAAVFQAAILVRGVDAMESFKWLPTESAPREFPMEIVEAQLIFSDGTFIYMPSNKIINNGWGKIGSTHIGGQELMQVPQTLSITWFSYAEDKFYSGKFSLPQANMYELFRRGLTSPIDRKAITYSRIVVGMAPEGWVSIWLAAQGVTLEVATFKAEQANFEWAHFKRNSDILREEYVSRMLKSTLSSEQVSMISERGVPAGLYEIYATRYSWSPEVNGSILLRRMWIEALNGEVEHVQFPATRLRTSRAVPLHFDVDWTSASKRRLNAQIELDEEEAMKAFDKMNRLGGKEEMKLRLDIGDEDTDIDIFLAKENFIFKFEKARTNIYKGG